MRPVPAAPADMEAHAILGNSAQRMIQRLDLEGGPFSVTVHIVVK